MQTFAPVILLLIIALPILYFIRKNRKDRELKSHQKASFFSFPKISFAGFLIVAGIVAVIASLSMNTSVEVPGLYGQRVHNADLADTKRNYLTVSCLILAIGIALKLYQKKNPSSVKSIQTPDYSSGKKCPYCAETIKAEAIICRYCGKELTPHV